MTRSQLENGELLVEISLQRTDGRTEQVSPPFPVRRRSKFYGNRHMWQMTVPNLKRHLGLKDEVDKEVASVTARAIFTTFGGSSDGRRLEARSELVLIPYAPPSVNSTKVHHVPRLQLTTSTPDPRVGQNVILHLRSNYDLGSDYYLTVMSGGKLLTSKQDSMGFTKLRTFDELITSDMTPSVTFVLWNLDSRGSFVHTSLTLQTQARTNTTMSGQSVIDGNAGYSELSFTGEPNTIVALRSTCQEGTTRLQRGVASGAGGDHGGLDYRVTYSSSVSEEFSLEKEVILLTDSNEFQPAVVGSHAIATQDYFDLCHPPHNQV